MLTHENLDAEFYISAINDMWDLVLSGQHTHLTSLDTPLPRIVSQINKTNIYKEIK